MPAPITNTSRVISAADARADHEYFARDIRRAQQLGGMQQTADELPEQANQIKPDRIEQTLAILAQKKMQQQEDRHHHQRQGQRFSTPEEICRLAPESHVTAPLGMP